MIQSQIKLISHGSSISQSGDTTYNVILEAYTQNDCFADTSFEVIMYPDPIAEIELDDNSDTLNCAPFTISSQHIEAVEYPENNTTYQWTFYNTFLIIVLFKMVQGHSLKLYNE